MAKVCVVIPCYNHGKYIDEAIQSIQKQTFQDFEIIVVDDGSTDEFTVQKLKTLNYPKTQIIHQQNSGPIIARNRAISLTTAEYILPLDADDYFDITYIDKAVKLLDHDENIGVVTCFVKSFGKYSYVYKPLGGGVENFINRNNACGNSIFRRVCWEKSGGYKENMKHGSEDWDFWIGVLEKGWRIDVIAEPLFYYRRLENSRDSIAYNTLHPELMKNMVSNHIETFQAYILQYVFTKETELLQLRHELDLYKLKTENINWISKKFKQLTVLFSG